MPPRRFLHLSIVLVMTLSSLWAEQHSRRIFLKLTPAAESVRVRSAGPAALGLEAVDAFLNARDASAVLPAFANLKAQDRDPYGLSRIYVAAYRDDQPIDLVTAELSALAEVEYAEPIYRRELYDAQMIPNDPYFNSSWHHTRIETPDAWDIQTGADSIIIAIIDSGIDLDHPDLVDHYWSNPNEIPANGIDDDNNGLIDDVIGWDFSGSEDEPSADPDASHDWGWHPWSSEDHGTHCAGIAAAVTDNAIGVAGVSHHSQIMGLKIFPNAWDDVCADAITYAADHGAQVLSNSWGGGGNSSTIQAAILYARNVQDCVVLFASGNDGESSPHYPGAMEGTVCVGATNSSDNRASFSNYGSWVDMCAPGTGIWSCVDPANPAHNNQYDDWDGTSMATPVAAGVAALIRSQFPTMDATAVEARLLDGDDVGNLQMGFRVNARKALTAFNISHAPLNNTLDMANDYLVSLELFAGDVPPTQIELKWAVNGSAFATVSMTDAGNNIYEASIPAQEGGAIVEYYLYLSDGSGNTLTQPASAPEQPYFFLVGSNDYFTNLVIDQAETDEGWTLGIPEDDADTGIWVREDPIGTNTEGNPLQPEDDHSDPGTICYVTGNAAFDGSNYGAGDVDGGSTTLVSPLYTFPAGSYPVLSYWRWYTNDLGDNPGTDIWQVQISDGSDSWIDLEATSSSANEWVQRQFVIRHFLESATQFQLRFIAADDGGGSLVEAAVDDLRLFVGGEPVFSLGDVNADLQLNVQDIILIVAHIMGQSALTGNAALAADFNQDGQVNVQDLVNLVAVIIGD